MPLPEDTRLRLSEVGESPSCAVYQPGDAASDFAHPLAHFIDFRKYLSDQPEGQPWQKSFAEFTKVREQEWRERLTADHGQVYAIMRERTALREMAIVYALERSLQQYNIEHGSSYQLSDLGALAAIGGTGASCSTPGSDFDGLFVVKPGMQAVVGGVFSLFKRELYNIKSKKEFDVRLAELPDVQAVFDQLVISVDLLNSLELLTENHLNSQAVVATHQSMVMTLQGGGLVRPYEDINRAELAAHFLRDRIAAVNFDLDVEFAAQLEQFVSGLSECDLFNFSGAAWSDFFTRYAGHPDAGQLHKILQKGTCGDAVRFDRYVDTEVKPFGVVRPDLPDSVAFFHRDLVALSTQPHTIDSASLQIAVQKFLHGVATQISEHLTLREVKGCTDTFSSYRTAWQELICDPHTQQQIVRLLSATHPFQIDYPSQYFHVKDDLQRLYQSVLWQASVVRGVIAGEPLDSMLGRLRQHGDISKIVHDRMRAGLQNTWILRHLTDFAATDAVSTDARGDCITTGFLTALHTQNGFAGLTFREWERLIADARNPLFHLLPLLEWLTPQSRHPITESLARGVKKINGCLACERLPGENDQQYCFRVFDYLAETGLPPDPATTTQIYHLAERLFFPDELDTAQGDIIGGTRQAVAGTVRDDCSPHILALRHKLVADWAGKLHFHVVVRWLSRLGILGRAGALPGYVDTIGRLQGEGHHHDMANETLVSLQVLEKTVMTDHGLRALLQTFDLRNLQVALLIRDAVHIKSSHNVTAVTQHTQEMLNMLDAVGVIPLHDRDDIAFLVSHASAIFGRRQLNLKASDVNDVSTINAFAEIFQSDETAHLVKPLVLTAFAQEAARWSPDERQTYFRHPACGKLMQLYRRYVWRDVLTADLFRDGLARHLERHETLRQQPDLLAAYLDRNNPAALMSLMLDALQRYEDSPEQMFAPFETLSDRKKVDVILKYLDISELEREAELLQKNPEQKSAWLYRTEPEAEEIDFADQALCVRLPAGTDSLLQLAHALQFVNIDQISLLSAGHEQALCRLHVSAKKRGRVASIINRTTLENKLNTLCATLSPSVDQPVITPPTLTKQKTVRVTAHADSKTLKISGVDEPGVFLTLLLALSAYPDLKLRSAQITTDKQGRFHDTFYFSGILPEGLTETVEQAFHISTGAPG